MMILVSFDKQGGSISRVYFSNVDAREWFAPATEYLFNLVGAYNPCWD